MRERDVHKLAPGDWIELKYKMGSGTIIEILLDQTGTVEGA